jgi:hypothetical protein
MSVRPVIEFSFVATPDLGPKALRFLLWRRAGPVGPLAIILVPLLVVFLASDPVWRPAAYVLGGGAIMLFLIFLLAVAYRRRVRRRFFENAADHTVKVFMSDEGLAVKTALGSSTLLWKSFERLWQGKSVVLLFFNGWQYVAFPAEAIPKAALDFASSKMKAQRR